MSFFSDKTFTDFVFYSEGSGLQFSLIIIVILIAFVTSYLISKYIFQEIGRKINPKKEKIFYILGLISSIFLGISPAIVAYMKYKIGKWTDMGSSYTITISFDLIEYMIYLIFLCIFMKILISEIESNEKNGKLIFIGGFIALSVLILGIILEVIKIIN